jgi:glucose/arabinose dehydrogenase
MAQSRRALGAVTLRRVAVCAGICALAVIAVPGVATLAAEANDPRVVLTKLGPSAMTAFAVGPGDPTLYVAEQKGRVYAVTDAGVDYAAPVLDLSDRTRARVEQGLIGMTFSPDGTRMYVDFTALDGANTVEEYAVTNGRPDPATRRVVLRVPRRAEGHNGGQLAFGRDGMLYIALGAGVVGDVPKSGSPPGGNGQSLDTLLGKILRIDPRASGDAAYTIPPDNPFADGGGRPEIWAYGLRNPWRFSFDRAKGDLWVGDVGSDAREEIDLAPATDGAGRGVNFGWSLFEGRHRAHDGQPTGGAAQGPLLDLRHSATTCAVIGGFVYRGTRIPALEGAYVYGDFCGTKIRWLRTEDGVVTARGTLAPVKDLASFGEDAQGELYTLSLADGLFRIDPAP